MRRLVVVAIAVASILGMGATAALAAPEPQASGQGQTTLSASLGFVAKADLSGQLNYVADPNGANAGFRAHCDGYTRFESGLTKNNYPMVRLWATCTDENGTTVYLHAKFIDRGEPGTMDTTRVFWSYSKPVVKNAFIIDWGHIQSGNVQILGV